MNPTALKRFRNLIVAAVLGAYLLVCAWSIATTRSWINRPFPGFLVIKHNYVATLYLASWSGFRAGVKNLDRVLAVDGRPVSSPRELYGIVGGMKPGTLASYTVERGGNQLTIQVPVSTFTARDYFLCLPFAMLLGLVFCCAGLGVFYMRPEAPPAWFITLSFLALGALYGANGERCLNGVNFLPNLFMPLMGPPFLLFGFYFPVELKRRRELAAAVIAIMLVSDALYLYGYFTGQGFLLFDRLYLLIMFVCFLTSVILQVYSYFASADRLVKQKAKVAIFGFVLALIGIAAIYFWAILPKRNNFFTTGVPAALVAVTMGYAVVKHNLFDVDVFIRRSITYLLLSGIVVAAFLGVSTLLAMALQDLTGQSSQIAAVVSTLLIVLLFNPLRRRIDRVVDRRFFREQYEYTATIRKAGAILAGIINLDELLSQLLDTVVDAVKIERGVFLIKSSGIAEFTAATANGYGRPLDDLKISGEHPLLAQLALSGKAIQVNDIRELAEFEKDRDIQLALMAELGLVLAIPVLYESKLIGLLGLGEKKSGAWYSTEDMELLTTLMIQTAVSIENARKVEELKKMVELETSYRDLKKLDEMKDNFLSMVSHDLRTPMTSIKGYAAILKSRRKTLDEEKQDRYLNIIINESDRLTRLINNLLDLQRLEAGRMKLTIETVDIAELAHHAVESFHGAAITKQIELEGQWPERHFPVSADRDRMSQVLANLLSNAIKFTPVAGRVRLSLDETGEEGNKKVEVRVSDNGPGIPPEQLSRLWSKFQQVEGPTRAKEEGSGLGLALVKEIVEAHGGKVGAESQVGKGSSFYFTLNLEKQE